MWKESGCGLHDLQTYNHITYNRLNHLAGIKIKILICFRDANFKISNFSKFNVPGTGNSNYIAHCTSTRKFQWYNIIN